MTGVPRPAFLRCNARGAYRREPPNGQPTGCSRAIGTERAHLAFRVLAAGLRPLSEAWRQVYGHPLVPAETFVEMSRLRGTCYRAANSICVLYRGPEAQTTRS